MKFSQIGDRITSTNTENIDVVPKQPSLNNKLVNLAKYVKEIEEVNKNKELENKVPKQTPLFTDNVDNTTPVANNQLWVKDKKEIDNNILNIIKLVKEVNSIVNLYENRTEEINPDVTDKLKSRIVRINSLLDTTYKTNTESTFKGYVEIMNSLVQDTAQDIHNVKNSIQVLLDNLTKEISSFSIEDEKNKIKTIWQNVNKLPSSIITVIDYIMLEINKSEVKDYKTVKEIIKANNNYISSIIDTDSNIDINKLKEPLNEQEIINIANAFIKHYNVQLNSVKGLRDIQEGKLPVIAAFFLNVINNTDEFVNDLLKVGILKDNNECTVEYVNEKINKNSIEFLNNIGLVKDNVMLGVSSIDGTYTIEDEKIKIKKDNQSLIELDYTRTNKIINTLEGLNMTKESLLSVPENLIKVLNHEAYKVDNTDKLTSITIGLGTILTCSNIYRDGVVNNIFKLFKNLNNITLSYYQLSEDLNNYKNIPNIKENTEELKINKLSLN